MPVWSEGNFSLSPLGAQDRSERLETASGLRLFTSDARVRILRASGWKVFI